MPSTATLLTALGNDLSVVDGAQSVQLTMKDPLIGPNVTVTIPDCVQSDFGDKEISQMGGYFQFGDTKFTFEDNKLMVNGVPTVQKPNSGDSLLDASGTTWELLDANQDEITLAWECVARKAR